MDNRKKREEVGKFCIEYWECPGVMWYFYIYRYVCINLFDKTSTVLAVGCEWGSLCLCPDGLQLTTYNYWLDFWTFTTSTYMSMSDWLWLCVCVFILDPLDRINDKSNSEYTLDFELLNISLIMRQNCITSRVTSQVKSSEHPAAVILL